ncbi:MAG: MOSC domain-containing protein [Pseudomonadota bacterium]
MPALIKTNVTGTVRWLGKVSAREATSRSKSVQQLFAAFAGSEDERHSGLTRKSCLRVTTQYEKGTEIRNTRQFSIVSSEELQEIAEKLSLKAFDPEWCGASIVLEGIPDFSHIPPSSRLQSEQGTTLTVDLENHPCNVPGWVMNEDVPGIGKWFKTAAKGRRGVTAWVEREGALQVGDVMTLHVPEQRSWAPYRTARLSTRYC